LVFFDNGYYKLRLRGNSSGKFEMVPFNSKVLVTTWRMEVKEGNGRGEGGGG
jgi:hypothetical protein